MDNSKLTPPLAPQEKDRREVARVAKNYSMLTQKITCFITLKSDPPTLEGCDRSKGRFIEEFLGYNMFGIHLHDTILLQHTGLRGSIDPLLEEADIDKDGKISISEFRRLLRTASMSSPTVRDSRGM